MCEIYNNIVIESENRGMARKSRGDDNLFSYRGAGCLGGLGNF